MLVNNWITFKSILPRIAENLPDSAWDEATVLELCYQAMDAIGVYQAMETTIKSINIKDYKAVLPSDLRIINQIAYKVDSSAENLDELVEELKSSKNEDKVTTDLKLTSYFINSQYYNKYYKPLKLSTSSFAGNKHCKDCINLTCESEHSYTIVPGDIIRTSFKKGNICVSYQRIPLDCDGDFLIPDIESYKRALETYCLYRLWERRWNALEDQAERRMLYYQSKWDVFHIKALNDLRELSVDDLENLRKQRMKLFPENRHWETFFENLNVPERIYMQGRYSRNNRRNGG